ncbi:hypothetical protein GUJ93_ZPchr0003g18603 [Zizania palustris]|uniref:Transcription repressor n=1 Tax=Zizania palustris TaxID=103762 RepID=A0A8J5VXX9_ZIZPA|nr:hypothetical protein GUJ93_ZPchr0003g18603 [Zizania palustris]
MASSWCWFHKLRRLRRKKKSKQPSVASPTQAAVAAVPAEPCSYCPNRESYYVTSAERARQDRRLQCVVRTDDDEEEGAIDVRVDVVHRRAERADGLDALSATTEIKLRPIVTRRHVAKNETSDGSCSSAAATPSTRARGFPVGPTGRRLRRGGHDSNARRENVASAAAAAAPPASVRGGRPRRRMWLYESVLVVKQSVEPERELAESMVEMVATNGVRSKEDLQDLLACYLALNSAEHHRAIVATFRHIWFLLASRQILHPGQ